MTEREKFEAHVRAIEAAHGAQVFVDICRWIAEQERRREFFGRPRQPLQFDKDGRLKVVVRNLEVRGEPK